MFDLVCGSNIMFHDPMVIAQEKMTKVCMFLEQHHLPPTPLNYQVAYTYISKSHNELNQTLDYAIRQGHNIDSIFIEQLYFEHLNRSHEMEASMLKNVDGVVTNLANSAQQSQRSITNFAEQVSICVNSLDEHNIAKTKHALTQLAKHTEVILQQHKKFKETLQKTRLMHREARQQLTKLRKEQLIDVQTGLYKRHYLNQQAQLWITQDKPMCAISIQINNLHEFSEDFGDLVSEVVLNRVAKKIQKYVFESGLPGRTAKDEFVVLMSDIEPDTANIIAEKIRVGVEKLKFVSSKSDKNLPKVDLSFGIAKRNDEENFNALARKATHAAHKAHSLQQSAFIAL
ncbi:diguanylate cyclase [Pseudoalteromonas phenolica]|uniref:Diguanylate cyclase n=2 Tax=Pseudoalteromonas phenolica TaxID=161398 RepID=A0A0S2K6J4_9GAMM|nr:diguanylate cyclase [Pseudoalteromonas phenolica]